MIAVTKLNGKEHIINAIFIEHLEATPDTVVTLTTGKKYVVKESVEQVIAKVKDFYREISLLHKMNQTDHEENGMG